MPNRQRQKGDRFERETVHAFEAAGIWAERVPLSGAVGGSFGSDIELHSLFTDRILPIECKTRARAWGDLFGWLKHDKHPPFALAIKADRTDTLIVMSLEDFAALLRQEI